MRPADAIEILGISGEITPEKVQSAWKLKLKEYHPDINPAGAEMAKLINEARDSLSQYKGTKEEAGFAQAGYAESLNTALNAIIDLDGLKIEQCGAWLWVGGNTKTHKDALKGAGFKWAQKKKLWSYRPEGYRTKSRGGYTMDQIRARHGSKRWQTRERPAQSTLEKSA